jgi:pimeloyl-ACP methyl ester carboxylesterase
MGRRGERQSSVRGLTFAVRDSGGPKRPVVLVHGFTGSSDDWSEVFVPLESRLDRVITFDLRGHGGSTNVGSAAAYSIDAFVEDLLALLDDWEVDVCDAIGHSLGGLVISEAARRAPARFGSLALMSTPLRPTATSTAGLLDGRSFVERLGAMRFAVNVGLTKWLARVGGMRTLTPFFVRSARVGPPAMRACREAMGPEVFDERTRVKVRAMDAHAFIAVGDLLTCFAPFHETMRSIKCPTLVMVGAEDGEFIPLAAEVLDELLAGDADARMVTVPNAAHSPQLENTDAWLELVVEHVRAARQSAGW